MYEAQIGGKHPAAKPLSGFGGAGVLEVVSNHDGDTFRAIYTVTLADAVYVLHAFQKKSKRGIKTPQHELEVIRARLRIAIRHHSDELLKEGLVMDENVVRGSENVFADLGLENPDEELLKAQLAIRLRTLVAARGLTQAQAAKLLSLTQPDVSALVNGRISGFSLERLFGLVRRLGDDVEITLKRTKNDRRAGRVRLKVA